MTFSSSRRNRLASKGQKPTTLPRAPRRVIEFITAMLPEYLGHTHECSCEIPRNDPRPLSSPGNAAARLDPAVPGNLDVRVRSYRASTSARYRCTGAGIGESAPRTLFQM